MKCWASSDSSYLSASKVRSRVGGHHFLGNIQDFENLLKDQHIFVNTPSYAEALTLKLLVGVASEAKAVAACSNARKGITNRITPMERRRPQHQT